MNPTTSARIAALVAALAAITIEDLAEVKKSEQLGPDIAQNIANLQAATSALDDQTIDLLNQARKDAGLPQA